MSSHNSLCPARLPPRLFTSARPPSPTPIPPPPPSTLALHFPDTLTSTHTLLRPPLAPQAPTPPASGPAAVAETASRRQMTIANTSAVPMSYSTGTRRRDYGHSPIHSAPCAGQFALAPGLGSTIQNSKSVPVTAAGGVANRVSRRQVRERKKVSCATCRTSIVRHRTPHQHTAQSVQEERGPKFHCGRG